MEPAPHRGNQSHRVEKAGALTLLVVGFLLLLLLLLLFFGFFFIVPILRGVKWYFIVQFVLFCFVLDEISVHPPPPTHTHTHSVALYFPSIVVGQSC